MKIKVGPLRASVYGIIFSMPPYHIRQCKNPQCRFRFPAPPAAASGVFCPFCGWETEIVHHASPAAVLERSDRSSDTSFPVVEALLDNIRSTYNVGSMFRAADGAGLRHLHLCGITPTPENPKVAKTALGAENNLAWDYSRNSVITAQGLKERGFNLVCLEASAGARSIFDLDCPVSESPILLVVGNEINGVDPDLLASSDLVVRIPMQGLKGSLNVALAFGIAVYTLRFSRIKHYI